MHQPSATYRAARPFVSYLALCRRLRQNATDAEQLLWHLVRARQVGGAKFRRQHQFGQYILDFYCPKHHLAIELDGGQHYEPIGVEKDAIRRDYLSSNGIRTLRFTNLEVLTQTESVAQAIWMDVVGSQPAPSP